MLFFEDDIHFFWKKRLEKYNKINNLAYEGVRLKHKNSNVIWEIIKVEKLNNNKYIGGLAYQNTVLKLKSLTSNKTKNVFLYENFFMYDVVYIPPIIKVLYAET